jgi:EAL domain-containing protein (putative c-di-GMP-specific phosphodiesterase class I)
LDNFGSDGASLSYFFKYDFDFIKLSHSLVNTLGMSDKYHTLVKSVVDIANNLGISVIGDGVLDEQTKHELQVVGCQYAQGEYISPEHQI